MNKGLTIQRIPDKTCQQFKLLAKSEFCDDYGMTLKHLVDFYFGIIPKGTEHLEIQIEELYQELSIIKDKLNKPVEEKKVPTRLDGTRIEVKEK